MLVLIGVVTWPRRSCWMCWMSVLILSVGHCGCRGDDGRLRETSPVTRVVGKCCTVTYGEPGAGIKEGTARDSGDEASTPGPESLASAPRPSRLYIHLVGVRSSTRGQKWAFGGRF